MPALSRRNAAPLLRQINGKVHATNDDHIDQLPTPPGTSNSTRSPFVKPGCATDEDITRSPVSSEDEAENARTGEQLPVKSASFQTSRWIDEKKDEGMKKPCFRRPQQPSSSPHSERSKRSRDDDDDANGSDGEEIFGPKRNKKSKGLGFANIHAPGRKKKEKQYGGRSQAREKATKFRKPEDTVKDAAQPRPKFQKARGVEDMFEFGHEEPGSSSGFRMSGAFEDVEGGTVALREKGSLSPSLSSLSPEPSSPIVEGVQTADISTSTSATCPICREAIPADHIMSFQESFTKGSPILNYRWQQRFCRWHKQQDAQRISNQRGYPDINWNRLSAKMQKFEGHLQRVIRGDEGSFHRDRLAEVLASGASKTAVGALVADGDSRRDWAGCGYYGPKGERVLTEHIIARLSADIRRQSTCDRLVAAAGVSGGVSGFVQAVLVPELAEGLICEDMGIKRARAREIMAESAEIGELLHPDTNDWVSEVDATAE